MVTLEQFYSAYVAAGRESPNDEQRAAIEEPANAGVFIVAGPGTGKTTSIVLRILKLVVVDRVTPRRVLATTFTKKAAAELRSRILTWGFATIEELIRRPDLGAEDRDRLGRLDVNQVTTGTIDSIAERVLRDFREAGAQPPIVIEEYVARTLLLRRGLFETGAFNDAGLEAWLLRLRGASYGWNLGAKTELIHTLWDRRNHDRIDWDAVENGIDTQYRAAAKTLGAVHEAYAAALRDRELIDFASLEGEMLRRLNAGLLQTFLDDLEVVVVDEYQDTNLLQEQIYLGLARATNGALTVVGDDDQSLYRFRGATVELFSTFEERYRAVFGKRPKKHFLTYNYRSTSPIVLFVNEYAELDPPYQAIRVRDKPRLQVGGDPDEETPVVGMFRPDLQALSADLSKFIRQVFRGDGYVLPNGSVVRRDPQGGDVGDCALLCSSPADLKPNGDRRLPRMLRNDLENRQPSVLVFNPRGQDFGAIPVVAILGGLVLECLDPDGMFESATTGIDQSTRDRFADWRGQAVAFANAPDAPPGLVDYASGWMDRGETDGARSWPPRVSVLQLIHDLVHFLPELHDDPEGQIYLEVFARQVAACEQVGSFSGRVITDRDDLGLSQASVKELLRNLLVPVASGTVNVDEDMMEAFPRDRLSVLSIHQSKGLEFPMVIVDVGSEFSRSHPAQAFKRFPTAGGLPNTVEDTFRAFSPLGAPSRPALDRAFDDLYRLYFVAFSRAEQVLVLVGLEAALPGGVPNVATGWRRDGTCPWDTNRPFVRI